MAFSRCAKTHANRRTFSAGRAVACHRPPAQLMRKSSRNSLAMAIRILNAAYISYTQRHAPSRNKAIYPLHVCGNHNGIYMWMPHDAYKYAQFEDDKLHTHTHKTDGCTGECVHNLIWLKSVRFRKAIVVE